MARVAERTLKEILIKLKMFRAVNCYFRLPNSDPQTLLLLKPKHSR